MARGRKKVSTSSLDAKIEQQKAVMEKAKLRYEAVIYSYSSHVRMLNANLPYLLDCFWSNVKQ